MSGVFWKYHGLGNSFILIDTADGWGVPDPGLVRRLCSEPFGLGADGVLVVLPSVRAARLMRIFNRDGSEAEMCGNGIRCFAKHLSDQRLIEGDEVTIESGAGLHRCRLAFGPDSRVATVGVSMGSPRFAPAEVPVSDRFDGRIEIDGRRFDLHPVSMGNPHAVIFVPAGSDTVGLARTLGPRIEIDPAFPARTNVEFVVQGGPDRLSVDVWERGAGITLACGTGACAVAAAAVRLGRSPAGAPLEVRLPGGRLAITVAADLSDVLMDGPAVAVCRGEWLGPSVIE